MGLKRNDDGSITLHADRLPGGVWGSNLRALLPDSRWRALSRQSAERAGRVCEVCKKPSRYGLGTRNPDCHELWSFEESADATVQRLVGVVALCGACHETQHSGLAELRGATDAVLHTLQRVNGWTQKEAEQDLAASVERYQQLSRQEWALDVSILTGWVTLEDYASLVIPADDRVLLGNTFDGITRRLSLVVGAEIPTLLWNW